MKDHQIASLLSAGAVAAASATTLLAAAQAATAHVRTHFCHQAAVPYFAGQ